MSGSLAHLLAAMEAAASAAAGAPASPVSVSFDWLGAERPDGRQGPPGAQVEITRVTRSLVFAQGTLDGNEPAAGGQRLSAAGVFRISAPA
jgi:hypothetical protein